MTGRRMLAGFVLLLAAATAAGCAQEVAGTGTLASDARIGGGGGPTGSPSPSPSPTSEPTDTPSATPSATSTSGPSPVCQALDEPAVEAAFGTSVTLSRSQSSGCQIRADDGRSAVVAVFDYLTLSEYKKPGSTDLQVGVHPAIRTSTTIIYVARSKEPTSPGLLAAYFGGMGEGGDAIAVKLLEQLLKTYSK